MAVRRWHECDVDVGEGEGANDIDRPSKTICSIETLDKGVEGERRPLRGTRRARPITLHNVYNVLQADVESGDEIEAGEQDDQDAREAMSSANIDVVHQTKHRPNK